MKKLELPPSEALYPVPVVLVSSEDASSKKANIITIAWCGIVCSVPPMVSVSIRPSRYSHEIITNSRDFVINIPTSDIMERVDLCGVISGRDTDKFRAASFTGIPSSKVSSPMIKECPVNIECKLRNVIRLGTHDMFIGEVVAVHVDENLATKDAHIDYGSARPFVFNQREYWDLGKKIGYYGCSKSKT
jgi:flavin reductase (DIM6/NTAB) family NADH-FMN oxidoreductase RutF